MDLKEIVSPLLKWYEENKRELPWRETTNPYNIWISEIMLQQTRVEAVKDYYKRFIERIPSITDLAYVDEEVLLKLWEGLGYYNRARNLKKAAKIIYFEYDCVFPKSYEQIIELPGIGNYTAGAIASIAYQEKKAAVDGNVLRVVSRLLNSKDNIDDLKTKKMITEELEKIIPDESGKFNQSLMELGAMICIPNGSPHCYDCPLQKYCLSLKNHTQKEIPVRKAKKKRRIVEKTYLVFRYRNEICLKKRDENGLLAGMYEFIAREGKYSKEEMIDFLDKKSIFYEYLVDMGDCKFKFTHIEWHMRAYIIELNLPIQRNREWVHISELDKYVFPTAIEFYLEQVKKGYRTATKKLYTK